MHPAEAEGIVPLIQAPHIRAVPWQDLSKPRPVQVAAEVLLSIPWLLASWYCAAQGWYPPALAASFVFYLTGLRQVHNAFHHTIGVPRWADTAIMVVLGVLMFNSMHAVRYNHLLHHRHCLDEHELEGASAHLPWWKVLLMGPLFPLQIHWSALRARNRRVRAWVTFELLLLALWTSFVFGVAEAKFLHYHLLAMIAGQCLSEFFCVWTVHHGCDHEHFIARTLRGRFLNWCTFGMFYHLEHHLFPSVPTCNLGELAKRIDAAAPELSRSVFSG